MNRAQLLRRYPLLHPDVVSPASTRVLLALIRVYERDGRATVRSVAVEAGLSSFGRMTQVHLRKLRRLGLCDWEDGQAGTLRPTVRRVA